MAHKVNTEFFGKEVPVAFMEMVRQTYIYEGTDPNKILSVYQAAKRDLTLSPWQESVLLERIFTLHEIRFEREESSKKLQEIRNLSLAHPSNDTDLVTGILKCQLTFNYFYETHDRKALEDLKTFLDEIENGLPHNQTIFDGRHHFFRAALLAHQGDISRSRLDLNHAIEIFKSLGVSYLEAACHLLALQTFTGEQIVDFFEYYNTHFTTLVEYPYIHREVLGVRLKTFCFLRDKSVNYLDKEGWRAAIKSTIASRKDLTQHVVEIQKTILEPLTHN